MGLTSTLKYIASHPLNRQHKIKSILRFFKWQISSRLNVHPIVYQFTDKAKLIIQRGMTGATGNLYCGLHEYEDMAFLLHFLREGDFFIDIGANVGSYTVLASAHVGADTFAFEPVPATFTHLLNNIAVNKMSQKVKAFNIAVGGEAGSVNFTSTYDTINHVVKTDEKNVIKVPMESLDAVLKDEGFPIMLKIDVEGFETDVIRGASATLGSEHLKAIIIELNGSGARYGYDENNIHETLLRLGFQPFLYHPQKRHLEKISQFGLYNTIYIRDLKFVEKRIESADAVRVQRALV